eukprot:NODE_2752_length_511_cov_703.333333_g2164_i0.p2 GENE.NODE_2752_length_511_cov_703.333333_g2164_i0~~NODE_2752_length_511_cov_703.333333_g2164_i0.p2  ORF type:complete len:76 (+),score=24.21 NODE_2752_length_511_cov_703.333333_g2164_i0:25-228(+)
MGAYIGNILNPQIVKNLVKYSKTLKVLYVEDNKEARMSTLLMLNNLFDDIAVAVDGLDGLELYKKTI